MLAAVVLTLGFAACSNDDNNGGNSEGSENERVRVSEWDASYYFQHAIATCDQDGNNFESFNWGVELYPDDPGHLYIGVDTWEEAVKIFNYWLAPNVKLANVPSSTEPLQIGLPDLKGEKQLDVFLKPDETDCVVAEMTMSDKAPTYSRIRKAYWTPDYDTAYEIRDLMKENWDTIKSAWNNADNGDMLSTSSTTPSIP